MVTARQARPGPAWLGEAGRGAARLVLAGQAWSGLARHGEAGSGRSPRLGVAGVEWPVLAWRVPARRGLAGTAW